MHLMQRNIAAWTLSFLRRHSLSTHEKPRSRRCKTVETDGLRGCTASLAWWLCRGCWKRSAWPRPAAVYCCSCSSRPKNIPNLCISEIYRWAESVSDSSKFRCPLAASKLGLHRQVIEAFELLNNFKYIFFSLTLKARNWKHDQYGWLVLLFCSLLSTQKNLTCTPTRYSKVSIGSLLYFCKN